MPPDPLPRGSLVTTQDEFRLCGAIVDEGFGNPLLTGRQTHANITAAVPRQDNRQFKHVHSRLITFIWAHHDMQS